MGAGEAMVTTVGKIEIDQVCGRRSLENGASRSTPAAEPVVVIPHVR
jgi:hypothetical protein